MADLAYSYVVALRRVQATGSEDDAGALELTHAKRVPKAASNEFELTIEPSQLPAEIGNRAGRCASVVPTSSILPCHLDRCLSIAKAG